MRGSWAAGIVVIGCGEEPPPTPREAYDALEARVETDCGVYENNTPADEVPPPYLCGEQPDVGCINGAIAGTKIARLKYSFTDPTTLHYREWNYYAGDGKLVWIGFFERDEVGLNWWYQGECQMLTVTSFEAAGSTCWKFASLDCEQQ